MNIAQLSAVRLRPRYLKEAVPVRPGNRRLSPEHESRPFQMNRTSRQSSLVPHYSAGRTSTRNESRASVHRLKLGGLALAILGRLQNVLQCAAFVGPDSHHACGQQKRPNPLHDPAYLRLPLLHLSSSPPSQGWPITTMSCGWLT